MYHPRANRTPEPYWTCEECGRTVAGPPPTGERLCSTPCVKNAYPIEDERPVPHTLKTCTSCKALIPHDKAIDLCDVCIPEQWRILREVVRQGGKSDWRSCSQPYGMSTRPVVRWQDAIEGAILYAEFTLNWPLYGRGRAA